MRTIYSNGKVYTGDGFCEAFIVEDNHFIYAGSNEEALKHQADQVVDLDGKFVCAGFNDSHMHVLNYGQSLNMAPLYAHTTSLKELKQCLIDFINSHPARMRGNWIMGRGWNQDYFTDVHRMPNRYDLDEVSSEYPICAVRACGHALVLNSKAIELLNLDLTKPIEGGQIVMENGVPNGIFFDNAMNQVYRSIDAVTKENIKDMLRLACKALNRYGVTSAQTDDYCVFRNVPWQLVNEAYQELEASGELTVRIYEQSNFTTLNELKNFVESGNNTGKGTEHFKIGPLKMLGDGALGARTAYLSQPYADDSTTSGIPVFSKETFDEMIDYANGKGMQVAIHTIGDACLDWVLQAIEKALNHCPRENHRHGIVHCQITREEQLRKMAEMKLHIYAQSIFLDYDINIVEKRVGKELASTSYSWKTLKDLGATVSNGTDCPVELPFALGGIQCAVTRQNLSGTAEPYLPKQAFSVKEALDSYTLWGAYASFEENIKGKIKTGMLADFVVLNQSPFEVQKNKIKDIEVLETWMDGKRVY